MRAGELALLYLLVGMGASAAVLARHQAARAQRALDAALVLAFWPLYGPLLLLGSPAAAAPRGLAALAPGPALVERIGAGELRLVELDALLARPEHCETRALAREAELRAVGDEVGERLTQARVEAIRRLGERRQRLARELDQARELLVQLRLQSELVRLGDGADEESRALLAELSLKVECLDEIARALG